MANKIIETIYRIKDGATEVIKKIGDALTRHGQKSEQVSRSIEQDNARAAKSFGKLGSAIGGLRTALGALAGFIGLRKLQQGLVEVLKVGEKFEDLEKVFATAFGGIEEGQAALERIRATAAETPFAFEEIADAAIRMKRAGFDPLDGSLQALIDRTVALDGTAEQLVATIDTLGKANIKGSLGLRELAQLTKQGIPVFELLGKSLGKSADEIRELAKSGELGRGAIASLVAEVGKLSAGAAKRELADLEAQVTKLKDAGEDFLKRIANAGALDFFRKKLTALRERIAEMAQSGELQALAQRISDGITSTAQAIGSALSIVQRYSTELLGVAKAYLAIKAINLTGSMASAAKAFLLAQQAAVASSGAAATLGAALKRIPTSVKIVLGIVGFELAQRLAEGLGRLLAENSAAAEELTRQHEAQRKALFDQIGAAREAQEATIAFRDEQVKSAEDVARLNAEELSAYRERLTKAQEFNAEKVREALLQQEVFGKTEATTAAIERATARASELAVGFQNIERGITLARDSIAKGFDAAVIAVAARIQELVDKAKRAAEGVQGIFKDVDFGNAKQLDDLVRALGLVSSESGKAAQQIRTGLVAELERLNDADLLKFQAALTAAFEQGGQSAEQLGAIMDATLAEALRRLGVNAQAAGVEVTDAGAKMIAAFNAVAENANATGEQIGAAFRSAIEKAQTEGEIRRLETILKAAFEAGKISAEQFGRAAVLAAEKLLEVKTAAAEASGALDTIGAKGRAAAEEVIRSWERARADIAAKAQAIASELGRAMDAGAPAEVLKPLRDEYAALDGQIAQINGRIDEQRKALQDTGTQGGEALQNVGAAAEGAGEQIEGMGQASASAAAATIPATSAILDLLQAMNEKWGAVSENARQFFVTAYNGAVRASLSIGDVVEAIARADEATQRAVANQQAQLAGIGGIFQEFAERGADAAEHIAQRFRNLTDAEIREFADAVRDGRTDLSLLGQQDLDALAASIDRAADKAAELAQQAADARHELEQLNAALQDDLDRASGNDEAIARRRYEERLAQIERLAERGGELALQQAQEARARAAELLRQELEAIQQRRQAERLANEQTRRERDEIARTSNQPSGGTTTTTPGSAPARSSARSPAPPSDGFGARRMREAPAVVVNVTGSLIGANKQDLAESLARMIEPQLTRIALRRR